ncbi:MAG: DciA family protein [Coriobacteriia bacterium]|nr:DciA family protein [Coriobacteriia bacterium]
MARRRELKGLGDVAARVLKRADPKGRRFGAEAISAWKDVAGPEIDRHTYGFALRDNGEFVVYVDSAAWANQLSLMSDQLTDELNTHLGHTAVKAIRFTVSRKVSDQADWETTETETDAFYVADDVTPEPLDATELDQVAHVAAVIHDPRLREVARRVMVKDLERKKGARTRSTDGL